MKRPLLIAAACVAFAAGAYARDYTYLDPPTLAVADFEVSMSAARTEASKEFYGQLISQALLSVLVQQNAANVVYTMQASKTVPGAPVYDPGMTAFAFPKDAKVAATDNFERARNDYEWYAYWYAQRSEDYKKASDKLKKAVNDEKNAANDKDREAAKKVQEEAKAEQQKAQDEQKNYQAWEKQAMQDAVKAANEVAVTLQGLQELARIKGGQVARLYFPSIFKIYDKKYVESALENGTFTVKDLYTKAVNAFNFTDLDFLVLGNVYATNYGKTDLSGFNAIGFNVRVLNTKRAEEVYSYSAVVSKDLHDLPMACAQVCQRIMIDILNAHCAQFTITEAPDVSGAGSDTGAAGNASGGKLPDLSYANDQYFLFWQPRQVEKDDNTVGDSDHSDKRRVQPDLFYWTLPGQYVISVYNRNTQQIKEIPLSIATGDVRNVVVTRDHILTPNGTITIGGIGPTTSYTIEASPKKQSDQYWWEIFDPPNPEPSFTVTFDNGAMVGPEPPSGQGGAADSETVHAEYRYETQDILISNVPLAAYDITVTRNPPEGLSGITGIWYTSTKLTLKSMPMTVTVRDPKDVKLKIADFGFQEKQQIESPKTTKVTFILQPGFGYRGDIDVDDQSLTVDEFHWADKEKITISSEYSQTDWETFPEVTYTVWIKGESKSQRTPAWAYSTYHFKKSQIVSERDIITFVDLPSLKYLADQAAEVYEKQKDAAREDAAKKAEERKRAEEANQTGQALYQQPAKAAAPPAPARGTSKFFFNVGAGIGYGSYQTSHFSGYPSYTTSYSSSGTGAITVNAQLYWYLFSGLGLGVGGLFEYIVGDSPGGAVTFDMIFGDISKGSVLYTLDMGVGSVVTLGTGMVFLNAKKNGGLTMGADFCTGASGNFFATWSVSLNVGYMFGF
jgi:hypothetical protein